MMNQYGGLVGPGDGRRTLPEAVFLVVRGSDGAEAGSAGTPLPLLRLLTWLSNCGLNAEAPPLLRSARPRR
jgi:hypothetical protein